MANWTFASAPHNFASGTSVAVNYGTVAANSLLVVGVWWTDETTTCTVADNRNGAWTAAGPLVNVSGRGRHQIFFFNGLAAAGATTVTASFTGTTQLVQAYGCIYTGGSSTAADGADQGGAEPLTTISVNPVTTGASDLVFASCVTNAGSAPTQSNSGYTTRLSTGDIHNQILFDNASVAAGTQTITCGATSSAMWLAAAAFGAPGGGPVDTVSLTGQFQLA